MDPTEDLSARVLLGHILSTEPPRTPITRSTSTTQTTSSTRSSKRLSKKDAGAQTPQAILRRSLGHKLRESITRKSLPATKKRTTSVMLPKTHTPASTSAMFDDGDTPRHILMNILRTEPVKSPVVHEEVATEEPQPSSVDSSIIGRRPSVELSGLDLPDITIGNAASTAKGLSRKRPRQSLNVTAFEKRLKDGEEVEDENEEHEESMGDHSSLSLSRCTSLSLKTPFVDVQTEKRGLQKKVFDRRKISVEEFGAAVNKRQIAGVSSFVQVEQGLSETAYSEGFTLGFSKLSEPDITTDILHCNTALYAQPDAMTSGFSMIATQDKPTVMEDANTAESQKEEEKSSAGGQLEVLAAMSEAEEEQDIAESQTNVKDNTAESEEEDNRVEAQTDSHSEEDVATRFLSEEEEAAENSQTEEEQGGVDSHTEEDVATRSQSDEEEAAADSQTEEEQGVVDSHTEEDVATRSQSEEEEAAADSQTEEEQGVVDAHSEEDVATRSQSEEEEAAADSQTEEEQGVVDAQHEEDFEARPQSEEEEVAPDFQMEEEDDDDDDDDDDDAVDSQIEEEGLVDLQSVEDVVEYQSDQEDPAANSQPEDEHDGRPGEEDVEASEQLEPDLEHISRRAHLSEGGLITPVTVVGGDLSDATEAEAESDADADNSFTPPEVAHVVEDARHPGVYSPEEAAEQLVEEEEEDDDDDDDEDSDEIPSKTPAFVRQKINFFQPNPLASPSVFKNIQTSSSTGEGFPAPKRKQVRKKRTGPAKMKTDLPKSYLMGVFKHFAKTKVSGDVYPVLKEIMDKYFDRLAEDLETYAVHAKRKTIEVEDVELLLKRQGYVNDKVPVEVLIEKYLRMDQRKLLIPVATSGNVIFPKKRR